MANVFKIEDIREFIKNDSLELPVTLKLKKPVKYTDTEIIDSITIHREPTAGDIDDLPAQNHKMKDYYKPISLMTGETLILIRKLSAGDIMSLMEVFGHFLGGSQKTGEEA